MRTLSRTLLASASAVAMAAALAAPAQAEAFPEVIDLPDGWGAEGIASGNGTTVYAGSLATGGVYKADLRTGEGAILVPGQPGRLSVGLKHSKGLLFVAGGPTGKAYVYDAESGADVAEYQLGDASQQNFINDVTVTKKAAWFTNSFQPVIYRLPLRNGAPAGSPQALPLSGDWVQPGLFNANGIAATADGKSLVVINSFVGKVYRVDPATGVADEIVADTSLTSGDGILLRGRELSVVRNADNEVVVLRLSPDLSTATTTAVLTDPDFAIPTTLAQFGGTLYAVNARFNLPPGPFTIVKVDGS